MPSRKSHVRRKIALKARCHIRPMPRQYFGVSSAMFARPEDLLNIAGAGGRPFEEFVLDLVREEGFRHEIPPHHVHWDHRTNRPDGGRDIIVDFQHGDPNPPFVPQKPSIWSAKSGNDGLQPATLQEELLAKHHEDLRNHLRNGNPFIWCILQPIDEDRHRKLQEKATAIAKSNGFSAELIEFRTLTNLCTILNNHPGLVTKHLPSVAARLEEVLLLREWEQEDRFAVGWVDFAERSKLIADLQNHLRAQTTSNVLHLAGLSGVGKTRTVREACQADDLNGVWYVPRLEAFTDKLLRHLTRNDQLVARVIVDEVPLSELAAFQSRVRNYSNRLRFITIGPALRGERSQPGNNILILPEPETGAGVLAVVRQAGIGLSDPVLDSIASFSAHDLRLALMLVEATKKDGEFRDLPIRDGDDVWNRLMRLFRDHIGDITAFRNHYPYLTLSIDIGRAGEHRHELESIAAQFNVSVVRLDETIAAAAPCGLGVLTPSFFEAAPRTLAGFLFRYRVWPGLEPRIQEFLNDLPDRLLRRFIERCQECVGNERRQMEEALQNFFLMTLGSKSIERLADRGRSRLFKAWAELDPANGLTWLREAIDHASDGQLAALDGNPDGSGGWRGRRQVVWLCEELACFGEHFFACEHILFRLAQVETEPSIGNNSTVVWRQLFWPALSFTEVPFSKRGELLLHRLQAATSQTLPLVLAAVAEVLGRTPMRHAPPKVVGGRLVPEPSRPATVHELRQLQLDFAQRSLEGIGALPPELFRAAASFLITNLQLFLSFDQLQKIKELFGRVGHDDDVCRVLRLQLNQLIQFRERKQAKTASVTGDHLLNQLQQWSNELSPTDLAARIRELTAQDFYEVMRQIRELDNPGLPEPFKQLAEDMLKQPQVVHTLLDWFDTDKPRSAFQLGDVLGKLDTSGVLSSTVAAWAESGRCKMFIAGYLRGCAGERGLLPKEWVQLLDKCAVHHPEHTAFITLQADISNNGIRRVLAAVSSGKIPPLYLRGFAPQEWAVALDDSSKANILHAILYFQEDNPREFISLGLALIAAWTDYGRKPLCEPLIEPSLSLLRCSNSVRVDPSDWSVVLDLLASSHPSEVAMIALHAITSKGEARVHLEKHVMETLSSIAKVVPTAVMAAVGNRLRDEEGRVFFSVGRFHGLFEAIGLPTIQQWVTQNGSDILKYIARQLESPSLKDGVPFIPPVTNWVLTQFGNDPRILLEYCAGRHAGEVRVGNAREHREELEKAMAPFIAHSLPWVRDWAKYELKSNERDAEIDDYTDEIQERL